MATQGPKLFLIMRGWDCIERSFSATQIPNKNFGELKTSLSTPVKSKMRILGKQQEISVGVFWRESVKNSSSFQQYEGYLKFDMTNSFT